MPKRGRPQTTKVKRLTLYPQYNEGEERPARAKRPVLTREKPEMKNVPSRLPWYKDNPPKPAGSRGRSAPQRGGGQRPPYEANQPQPPPQQQQPQPQPAQQQAQPVQPVQPGGDDWIGPMIFIFVFVFVFIIVVLPLLTEDGGIISNCPTTCPGGMGVMVAPDCKCPSACPYYFIVKNPPEYYGYKQCSSRP